MNITPDQLIYITAQFQSMLTVVMKQNAEILAFLKKTSSQEEFETAMATYDATTEGFAKLLKGE